MKAPFGATISGIGRLNLRAAVVLLVLGVLIGVAIGPQARISFWTAILDWWPSELAKIHASWGLAQSEAGQDALRHRFLSPDKRVRELAILDLVFEAKVSRNLPSFLGVLPVAYVTERRELLGSLDYAEQHRMAIAGLCYELTHVENAPEVKAEARRILQSFADIKVDTLCQKMGVSLTENQGE